MPVARQLSFVWLFRQLVQSMCGQGGGGSFTAVQAQKRSALLQSIQLCARQAGEVRQVASSSVVQSVPVPLSTGAASIEITPVSVGIASSWIPVSLGRVLS